MTAAELFKLLVSKNKRTIVLPKNTSSPELEPENWQQRLLENPGGKGAKKNGHKAHSRSTGKHM